MQSKSPRPRSDLARNRARIIEAAKETVSEDGLDVSMREISRRAGLGIATVLRHFPNREELLVAVIESALVKFRRIVDAALATPPERALSVLFAGVAEKSIQRRGFTAALGTQPLPPQIHEPLISPILRQLERLASELRAQGVLRADVTGEDLLRLVVAMSYVTEISSDADCYRYADVIANGLRYQL